MCDSDTKWLRSELTQASLHDMALALGMTPGEHLRVSGSVREGWWLCGCAEGDCKLPMTKGAPTAREAYEHAYGWLAPEIEEIVKNECTRTRKIERVARALVNWVDEFVGDVRDHQGNSLTHSGEWDEVLEELRAVLVPEVDDE